MSGSRGVFFYTICPRSSDPFNKVLYKMGDYFLVFCFYMRKAMFSEKK